MPERNEEEETQDEISTPSKGYNINLLKKLDDQTFNAFEIKNRVFNKSDKGLEIKEDDDLRPEEDEIL